MKLFDKNEFRTILRNKSKILYYPSCGYENIYPGMFDLDVDLFVFSDYVFNPSNLDDFHWKVFKQRLSIKGVRRYSNALEFSLHHSNKTGLIISETNDICVKLLKESGIKISYLIGVNDGCCEGGNLSCNNTKEWFETIKELIGEKLIYITDHFRSESYSHDQSIPGFPEKIILPDELDYALIDIIPENEVEKSKYPFPPFFSINQKGSNQILLAVYSIHYKSDLHP